MLGVVRLVGDMIEHRDGGRLRCALPIAHGPSALLDADGGVLGVPRLRGDTEIGPGDGLTSALDNGTAIWGFAWLGAHCGSSADAIEIPLTGGRPSLHVPPAGPQPNCGTSSRSTLIDGIVGGATARSGGFGGPIGPHYPPCTRRDTEIRPGERLHVTIPATTLDEVAVSGSTVDLLVAVAGIGEVQLHATAR